MPTIYNEELREIDEKYGNDMVKLSGPTLFGFPDGCDASRLNMMTQNMKQTICISNPEFARIFTGFENEIGKHNKAYKKLKGTWEVKDKIYKFGRDGLYMLVLYDRLNDTYDLIEKKPVEDLTEKFGFLYNTDEMDKLEPGNIVTDKVIYRSTSYDKDMNYRMGVNANVMYVTDPSTIEDAIQVRKGWAESILTSEIDSTTVTINLNDVFLNLYGDDDYFKAFPNVGENVKNGTLCALRRVNYNHVLYDFQSKNMRELTMTDRDFVCGKNAMVYDIDIYCNNIDGLPDNIFYQQLKYYYESIKNYADKINEWCKKIKKSGSKYTNNIGFYKSKYQHFNDDEYKWKYKDRAFDNLVVVFKTKNEVSIQEGFKLVGRYGDKGVISKISNGEVLMDQLKKSILEMVDTTDMSEEQMKECLSHIQIVEDDEMPYTEDGVYVDILLNASGAIRRLNTDQIIEVDLNFISERIRQRLEKMDSYPEKLDLIFKFLELLGNGQYDFMYKRYKSLEYVINVNNKNIKIIDETAKREFVDEIVEKGFYIHKPPYSNMHYDMIKRLYKAFPWIEPYTVYVNRFGMRKKVMRKMVIGEKYMFVLKQTTTKNFSARSTGRLNKKNLPEKSADKKNNRDSHSRTPVRIGEAYNLFSCISPMTLSEYDYFMRSSPIARSSLKTIISSEGNPMDIRKLKIKSNYSNTNAIIAQGYFKGIGIRLNSTKNENKMTIYEDTIIPIHMGGKIIYDKPSNKEQYYKLFKLKDEYILNHYIIESYEGEKEDIAWNYIMSLQEVKDLPIYENMKNVIYGNNPIKE